MIPLRLTVKNFMCYRDNVPTMDLEGIRIACLCGDNGHGKSALLDAITWALWGQARARTQEELVHQGQQDMAVELEFLGRDQRYRVSRRYSRSARGSQGHTILALQAAGDDGFLPISEGVRETEERIRNLLHMDYDTFVNTALLLQGRADLFTNSTPAKRKEYLAEVLDLSYYQRLEELARDRVRTTQDEIRGLDAVTARDQQELDRRPEINEALATAEAALLALEPQVEGRRRDVNGLRSEVESLQSRRSTLDELIRRSTSNLREISELQKQVDAHQGRLTEYESAIANEAEIRQQFARLVESKQEAERLNHALAKFNELGQEKAPLEREIALQAAHLTDRAQQLGVRISQDLEPKANRLPELEKGSRALTGEWEALAELERALREGHREVERTAARIGHLEEVNGALKAEMADSRNKFDLLEQGETQCPVCRQPLGTDAKDHLRSEYEAQGQQRKRRFQENAAERQALTQQHTELSAQVSRQEKELDQSRQELQSRAATMERDMAEARQAHADLNPTALERDGIQVRLKAGDFADHERRRLAELEAETAALGYDREGHRSAQGQAKALESYADRHRKLEDAKEALPATRKELDAAQQMLDRRQAETRELEESRTAIEQETERLAPLESKLQEQKAHLQDLEEQLGEARVDQGVLRKQLETLGALASELRDRQKSRNRLVDEKAVYDDLAVAFGKNGVQALIIESAIPQLQEEANELLGRLTENRMFLRLQLREGRKQHGMPSEELEIKIADEVGTRSYETFSGGEAFRINFALRIALSKLLARRSGAPLPVLFIDEGFGSQDSSGQDRLREAIQSIQTDFEKIIVITHVDQVKEAFPTRIEVTKTESGSTFVVV